MILHVTPTPGLLAMLASRNDDDTPELVVTVDGPVLAVVLRADGSELSPTETAHVRATLAAHRVSPL